jgi:xylulose-5-phosphate/fructose-6-phosphate phosphoketolase
MIILRTPKGWTCPKEMDGHKLEGSWRAHQMPILDPEDESGAPEAGGEWMRSYRPEELFDEQGTLIEELQEMAPKGSGASRQSACEWRAAAQAAGPAGLSRLCREGGEAGQIEVSSTDVLAHFLRDVMRKNMTSFRVFGPDETASNKLDAIYEGEPEDVDGGADCRRMRMADFFDRTAA